ncbi:MAG: LuxR C-terminal-related transcriptional regulator [Muribaculaceae bacterium]|nr:LuxR C-terminal-related transcriptional regulator [Muribaculaceae bacterium]
MTKRKINITKRKKEILELLAEGYGDKEIAEELVITTNTAKTHIAQMFNMCQVNNRATLVAWGFRNGYLE